MITALPCAPEDELIDLWHQLSAEQKAVLWFVYRNDDAVLTYSLIAMNVTLPHPGGSGGNGFRSDRHFAKHCHLLENPPLGLLWRPGKRSGIQLTAKGARLMRLISREDSE